MHKRKRRRVIRFILALMMIILGMVIKIFIVGLDAPSPDKSVVHNFLLYTNIKPTPPPVAYETYLTSTSELQSVIKVNKLISSELDNMKTFRERDKLRRDAIIRAMNENLGGKLKNKGEVIYNASTANNYHPYLQCSIVIHETGNGTSSAIRNLNNVGGIFAGNSLKWYDSVDDGIWDMATRIKRYYIEEGLTTIDMFGAKYCPESDVRDVDGLNKHWVPAVTRNYIKLLNESSGVI